MSRRDEFLRSQKILRLATVGSDGQPHIVPVWYKFYAKKFYIGTNTKTQKARNLNRNAKASFCVDTGINSPDIFGVMGQGNANLILKDSTVKKITKKILLRYFDSLEVKAAVELLNDTDCIIEIIPEKLTVWSY